MENKRKKIHAVFFLIAFIAGIQVTLLMNECKEVICLFLKGDEINKCLYIGFFGNNRELHSDIGYPIKAS